MTLSNYFALNVDPSQALSETYNYGLVLLSYLVAVLGSYALLQFATRIAELRDAGLRYSWLAVGAIAMRGGIWAMHLIGMLAHVLPIPVSYDPWITALSIVPAILGAGVALHVIARPVITTPRLLIGGALMGGLIIGIVESLAAGYLDPYVGGGTKDFAPYVLMILVLMFRPYGIFGKRQIERV